MKESLDYMLMKLILLVYKDDKNEGGIFVENKKEYVKNIVHYLYITDSNMDIEKLEVLCNYLYESKFDFEFSKDEIDIVNSLIKSNDYEVLIAYMDDRKKIVDEVNKDILLENIDSLWQFVMDNAYGIWGNNSMSREEFLSRLTDYEKITVQFGNFNYQIENGGLEQWDLNGYSDDSYDLIDFLENCDFSKKNQFLNIIETFHYVKEQIEKLNKNDDFYESDCNTRYQYLDGIEKEYYSIKEDWNKYFENYLFENLPNEYIEKLKSYNLSNIGI